MGKAFQALMGDADLEAVRIFGLQQQCRDERDHVGVAATLAEAVQRALHLTDARADSGERIRDRVLGVVVGVDAEPVAGDAGGDHLGDDALDLGGKRAAIGVAEDGPAGAIVERGADAGERKFGVCLVAVEEVLAVDHRLAALRGDGLDAVGDAFEVFLVGDAERDRDMEVPAFRDEADGVRVGIEDGGQAGIVRRRRARAAWSCRRQRTTHARVLGFAPKNALSVGFAPGYPPST